MWTAGPTGRLEQAMTIVSERRAKQRAKKAAAQGGSHQTALDAIARSEGFRHWGDRLANGPGDRVQASPPVVPNPFDRGYWDAVSEDLDDVIAFAGRMLASDVRHGIRDALPTLAHIVADAHLVRVDGFEWMHEAPVGEVISRLISLSVDDHMDAIEAARSNNGFFPHDESEWGVALVRRLVEICEAATWDEAAMRIRSFSANRLQDAIENMARTAARIDGDALGVMSSTSVKGLPVWYLAQLVAARSGGVVLHPHQRRILEGHYRDMPAAEEVDRKGVMRSAKALGPELESVLVALQLPDLTNAGAGEVVLSMEASEEDDAALRRRVGLAVVDALPEGDEGLLSAWLRDAAAKVWMGSIPFTFNPVAEVVAEREGGWMDVAAALEAVVAPLVVAAGPAAASVRSGAATLIADLVLLVRKAGMRASEIGCFSVDPSLPAVRDVLASSRGADQLALFASVNGVPREVVARMRGSLANAQVMEVVNKGLSPFGNPSIAAAAS